MADLLEEYSDKPYTEGNPLDSYKYQNSMSKHTRDSYVRNMASIAKGLGADDFITSFENINNSVNNPEAAQKELTNVAIDEDFRSKGQQHIDNAISGDVSGAASSLSTDKDVRDNRSKSSLGPEIMAALAEKMPNATDAQIAQYVFDTSAQKDLSMLADKVGAWDYTTTIAGTLVIPGINSWKIGNLVGDSIFSAWGAKDKVTNAIVAFRSLPIERQKAMWPHLKAEVLDQMGDIRGIALLRKFITPGKAMDTEEYGKLSAALDSVDVAATALGLGFGALSAIKKLGNIRRISKLGNDIEAGERIEKILTEKGTRAEDAFGISKAEAAADAEPMSNMENISKGIYTGASSAAQKRLFNITHAIRKAVSGIREESPVVAPFSYGAGTEADKIAAVERLLSKAKPGYEVTDVTTKKVGPSEYETISTVWNRKKKVVPEDISSDTVSPEIILPYEKEKRVGGRSLHSFLHKKKVKTRWSMTLNDNEEYEVRLKTIKNFSLNSPKFNLRGNPLMTEDVEKALSAENKTAALGNKLAEQYASVFKLLKGNPLKKKKKAKEVEKVLQDGAQFKGPDGDEVGTIFSYDILKNHYGLSDDQIEFYYGMRQFSDSIGLFNNSIIRNKKILDGEKTAKFTYFDNGEAVNIEGDAKVFNNARSAAGHSGAYHRGGHNFFVFDSTEGKVVRAKGINWAEQYKEGKRLVVLKGGQSVHSGGRTFKSVLVNESSLSDLPPIVLKFREGYFPRFYPKGVYAHTLVRKGMADGLSNRELERKTVALYDNKHEAMADKERLLDIAKGEGLDVSEGGPWELKLVEPGSGMSSSEMGESLGGQMYTYGRGSRAVPFVTRGEETVAEQLSPMDSIQRQLGNIATHYPRHAHRIALADRIEKAARELGILDFDFRVPVRGGSEEREALEYLRKQYLQWASFRTKGETWSAARTRHLYENMVGRRGFDRDKLPAKLVWNMQATDPVQAIRSATFNLFLGMFNPSQLWVQSQGGMVAASVLPLDRTLNVARGMPALAVAMNTGKDGEKVISLLAKAFNTTEKDARTILKEYKATGYDNSIRADADIKQVVNNFADPRAVLKNGMAKGTIFYGVGERFNRRISWVVSMERYMKNHKITSYSKLTEADWHNILSDSNTFQLSMHAANKARWQNGWMSIPTQFMQVQAKFIEETLLNLDNGLTASERARIQLAQLFWYGSRAIPIVGRDAAVFMGNVLGMDEQEASQNEFLRNGMVGAVLHSLGVNIAASDRVALMSGITDMYEDIVDGDFLEVIGGAAGSAISRALDTALPGMKKAILMAGQGDYDPITYGKVAINSIGQLASSYNHLQKAIMVANQGGYIKSHRLSNITHVDWQTTLALAMGFNSSDVRDLWEMRKVTRARSELKSKGMDLIAEQWSIILNSNDDKQVKAASAMVEHVLKSYFSTDEERRKAMLTLYNNLGTPETEMQKQLKERRDYYNSLDLQNLMDTAKKAGELHAE